MNDEQIHEADKFIEFIEEKTSRIQKTKVVSVMNILNNSIIGHIKWYGAWRHYCFFPEEDKIFSDRCMCRIGIEIERLNREHHYEVLAKMRGIKSK